MNDSADNSKIILTGGADNIILAWKNQTTTRTYQGR